MDYFLYFLRIWFKRERVCNPCARASPRVSEVKPLAVKINTIIKRYLNALKLSQNIHEVKQYKNARTDCVIISMLATRLMTRASIISPVPEW